MRKLFAVLVLLCFLTACTQNTADLSSDMPVSLSEPDSLPDFSSGSSEPVSQPADADSSEQSLVSPESEPDPESQPESESEPVPEPELIRARQILSGMTLNEKICQLFIISPEQLTGDSPVTAAGEKTREALSENPVGGLIYFSKNLVSREQTAEMLEKTQSFSKYGLFLAVDEEGGLVSRVGNNPEMGTTVFPPMGQIQSDEEAYEVGFTIGTELLALGFNLDFAPIADVHSNFYSDVIGERAFSSDPNVAAGRVSACVKGFCESGILCTLKHFPGHGDTVEDSHYGVAQSEKTLERLAGCEFLPFSSGIEAGAPLVMVGHIALPNVTGEMTPATLCEPIVTGLLRERIGFRGVIVTDSMQMLAITENYSSGEAALLALEAGVDMILIPEDFFAAKEYLLEKISDGTLPIERIDESVLRILKAKLTYRILE
ncbi:MAG: hypothetical protein II713_04880 [Clostridia bacterium]|nr:hypothetical protein [Clostridia bacterium]